MVVHVCNPSTQAAEEAGMGGQSQPGLYNKFKTSLKEKKSRKER
jgi:hypothetical protein